MSSYLGHGIDDHLRIGELRSGSGLHFDDERRSSRKLRHYIGDGGNAVDGVQRDSCYHDAALLHEIALEGLDDRIVIIPWIRNGQQAAARGASLIIRVRRLRSALKGNRG